MTTVGNYRRWLHRKAQGMTRCREEQADLVQEGMLAMWQAEPRYCPGRVGLAGWLTRHAGWRMVEVVQTKSWTGRSRRSVGAAGDQETPSLDTPAWAAAERIASDTPLNQELLLAHGGDIRRAIDTLTPAEQKYVHARFWLGYTDKDMKRIFGYSCHNLWQRARPKLERELAHLRGALAY